MGLEKKEKKRKKNLMHTQYCIFHYGQIRSCYLQVRCSGRTTVFMQGRMWRTFYITDAPIIGNKTPWLGDAFSPSHLLNRELRIHTAQCVELTLHMLSRLCLPLNPKDEEEQTQPAYYQPQKRPKFQIQVPMNVYQLHALVKLKKIVYSNH